MGGEWSSRKLGEICDLRYGKFIAKKDLDGGPYPVFSGYGVVGYHSEYQYDDPQVVVVCRGVGGSGDIKMSPAKCWITNLSIVLTPKHDDLIDKSYLYWALLASERSHWISGSAQYQVTIAHLEHHNVKLPSIDEQRAIAHILGTLDDKIELNRRMNETLEEMARALFKSWFVDFDPVHAKAAGKKPFGMDEATAALFPDEFEESELGAIPKGWEATRLARATSYLRRGVQPSYCDEGGVLVINQKCVRDGRVDLALARRHDPNGRSIEGRELEVLDVLVNSTGVGTLGRVAVLPPDIGPVICDSHVTVVRAAPQVASKAWLALQLRDLEARIEGMGQGSTGQTELSRTHLGEMAIVLPPLPLQERFAGSVMPLLRRAWHGTRESETLASLRDTLLPKLLSGELRIKDAEKFAAEVA